MSEKGPSPASPSTAVERSLAALDAAITGCVALVLVYLVAGRIDLGLLTVSRVS